MQRGWSVPFRLAGVILGAFVTVVASAGAAAAHVTLSPSTLPQGTSDSVLTFQVPNESPSAAVVALQVRFPLDHPIAVVNPEAVSGWQVTTRDTALAKPITTDDGTFTSAVSEVDWSAGSIPVGQFKAFSVLAQGIPSGVTSLAFATIQSYSDGTQASWIQVPNRSVPNPSHPAPVLRLTSSANAPGGASPVTTAAPASGSTSSAGSDGLAVAALALAALAVALAALAVWLGRPPPDGAGSEESEAAPSVDVGAGSSS